MQKPIIGIILPCYNEEEVLDFTISKLNEVLNKLKSNKTISINSFIALVDDGSKDKTWSLIKSYANDLTTIKGLKLSKNVGHQNALLAGLLNFNNDADALISIDADLQDDISIIPEMINEFVQRDIQVVYAVRSKRDTDSLFKKYSALFFYKLMHWMKVNIVYNHADYRLCSNKIIEALSQYNEVNLFLRGIIPTIGFSSSIVYYERKSRVAGVSKYPLGKMLSFALNGITSFSNYPLKLVTLISFIVLSLCILATLYAIGSFFLTSIVPGWLSTVLPLYFLGGVQLFCLGIMGEYIAKIYSEVKSRPKYFIENRID
ncbi:glycosyltransferase [Flavobacteriaceae bacterium Ap0902]|nr:glycosyltransferase [Flavobacteriaceae bacterium Ap0902]